MIFSVRRCSRAARFDAAAPGGHTTHGMTLRYPTRPGCHNGFEGMRFLGYRSSKDCVWTCRGRPVGWPSPGLAETYEQTADDKKPDLPPEARREVS